MAQGVSQGVKDTQTGHIRWVVPCPAPSEATVNRQRSQDKSRQKWAK